MVYRRRFLQVSALVSLGAASLASGCQRPKTRGEVLAVLRVVFLAAARVLLQQLERLAIAEGRLTESGA